jgi:serine/threonine-protein phosphatase Stp1
MSTVPLEVSIRSAGRFRSCAVTHPGALRTRNEDNYVNRPDLGLWAVADGAGGHQAGDVAARIVTEALATVPTGLYAPEILVEVRLRIGAAHDLLLAEAARRGPDAVLASTIVVLLVRDDHFACLWAGDSRAYLLRDGRLTQVTRDHSLVQELLDAGEITAEEAAVHPHANIITRAVGAGDAAFALDKMSAGLHRHDRFLLCSDGLFKTVAERDLAALLAQGADNVPAEHLVTVALERQADDNVTALMVDVLAEPPPEDSTVLGALPLFPPEI